MRITKEKGAYVVNLDQTVSIGSEIRLDLDNMTAELIEDEEAESSELKYLIKRLEENKFAYKHLKVQPINERSDLYILCRMDALKERIEFYKMKIKELKEVN